MATLFSHRDGIPKKLRNTLQTTHLRPKQENDDAAFRLEHIGPRSRVTVIRGSEKERRELILDLLTPEERRALSLVLDNVTPDNAATHEALATLDGAQELISFLKDD